MKRVINITIGLFLLSLSGCILVDPKTLDFGSDETTKTFKLTVIGDVEWSITPSESWITVDPDSGQGTTSVSVTVDRTGMEDGYYEGALYVSSNPNVSCPDVIVKMTVGVVTTSTTTTSPTSTTTIDETTTTTTTGGGDIDLTMISIPGGTFEMGCSPGDSECSDDEKPRHTVTISSFKMSAYEITQGQWEAVMGSNPSNWDKCGPNCPVESVRGYEVQDFIEKLNQQTGKQYRLPTEAEWEYAARAGTTTRYYCGDDESCLDDIAWYGDNSGEKPHPVGQKQPNAWGLYDMSGNVEEWCSDWYDEDYYSYSPATDPQGPDSGSIRVNRGGSHYSYIARVCSSSNRYGLAPGAAISTLGFRLCLSQ